MTWEDAVLWLRSQPDKADLVRASYYDDPLLESAERFSISPEWQAVLKILHGRSGTALDIGAGRGIGSYALAKHGWQVTALEPDNSQLVGSGAIRELALVSNLSIKVIEDYGELLPFKNESFDLVYGRAVLHHARDLDLFCKEASRVLKHGGVFLFTREHVISKVSDLDIFLMKHPLHNLYGGENAYLLDRYSNAIRNSGLRIKQVFGYFDSVINYFPLSEQKRLLLCRKLLFGQLGSRITLFMTDPENVLGRFVINFLSLNLSKKYDEPGRLYSFLAYKP